MHFLSLSVLTASASTAVTVVYSAYELWLDLGVTRPLESDPTSTWNLVKSTKVDDLDEMWLDPTWKYNRLKST